MKTITHISIICLTAILTILLSGCSTTGNLPEGEVLYTGIKSVKIDGEKKGPLVDDAIAEVKGSLAYAPNNSFMGSSYWRFPLPIGLWTHNSLAEKENKNGLEKWLLNTFGSTPVTMTAVNPDVRTKVASNTLQNFGYFRGNVGYELVTQKNPKKQKVRYHVTLGTPYLLDSVNYGFRDTVQDSIIHAPVHWNEHLLKRGNQFSVLDLETERTRLSNILRNNGYYYFQPEYISYFADTVKVKDRVQLLLGPAPDVPSKAYDQWRIGDLTLSLRRNSDPWRLPDTTRIRALKIAHSGDTIPISPRVMFRYFRFRRGELFNQSGFDQTVANLNSSGLFSSIQINYVPADTTDTCRTLNVNMRATLDRLFEAELGANVTYKNNDRMGPNGSLTFIRRNVFGHGETFSLKLMGAYEWATKSVQMDDKRRRVDSYEAGMEASLTYPRLMLPWLSRKLIRRPSSTTYKFGINHQKHSGYYRLLSFTAQADYWIQPTNYVSHTFTPLTLRYNKLMDTTDKFDSVMVFNDALYYSIHSRFIPAMQYTFHYDDVWRGKHRSTWFEASVKEAGNLSSAVLAMTGKKWSEEDKHMFGTPYSQFIKFTAELRNKFRLTDKSLIATRLLAGAVWSYGNSYFTPYSEMFYAGGANSIRAFGYRSIGPGAYDSYYDEYGSYLDHAGDFQLEMNAEYRFPIVNSLSGALFVDAGNVWILKDDFYLEEGKLEADKLLEQTALGTGFGFRYDLGFLVLRFDIGVPLHAPYNRKGKKGFYNISRFRDSFAFHFAVGYPF